MHKLSEIEKTLLEITDREEYNIYRCSEHGIFCVRKDRDNPKGLCSYCGKECKEYE